MLINFEYAPHKLELKHERPYITEIQFQNKMIYGIIDNVFGKSICMYRIEPPRQQNLLEKYGLILDYWYMNGCVEPVSVTFEKQHIKQETIHYFIQFTSNSIVEINGPVYSFTSNPKKEKKCSIKTLKML